MRIAVIGSGAAALGVLDRLALLNPAPDITLFDRDGPEAPHDPPVAEWTPDALRAATRRTRAGHGKGFPPPKTNFAISPAQIGVEGWGRIWDSGLPGGLTTVWGLSCLPFSARDMAGWPISAADLAPHYRAMAGRVGVAGRTDSLNAWLGEDFANRPPAPVPPLIEALERRVNAHGQGRAYDFVAGASRLALETRTEAANACVACGECMLGCPRGAMYSTLGDIRAWRAGGLIGRTIPGRVLAVDRQSRNVICLRPDGSQEAVGPFDKIYVCAGCPNTTEIAMRSLDIRSGPEIVDSAVYTFPILHAGFLRRYDLRRYFSLTNALVGVFPRDAAAPPVGQIQIYPIFDHLWRYYAPPGAWGLAAPFGRMLRRRFLLGRIFMHGDWSQRYAVSLSGDGRATFSLASPGATAEALRPLWADIRRVFSGAFHVPPVKPLRQRTSSHYAASMPMGAGPVAADCSIAPGIYLCDSTVFSTAPATSPTFTIMANARRIAHDSLA